MKILPTLAEVKEFASAAKYNVLPVNCEILSDFTTPIETMKILKNVSTHCYMLESAQANETWGRYTFLGFDPKMEITCMDGEMKIGNLKVKTDNPSDYLRQILADYKSPRFDYLPSFTGGLVGYFSYDYLTYSEPTVKCDVEDTEAFKDVDLMLFDKVIAFDLLRQKIILIVNMPLDEPETGYNKAVMELNQLVELLRNGEKKNEPGGKLLGEVTPLFNKEQFCGMVEKAKHHIREGDIFQIVLSNRLSAPFEGSLLNTYRMLRTINPSPYMFYFSGTDVEVAGASPEASGVAACSGAAGSVACASVGTSVVAGVVASALSCWEASVSSTTCCSTGAGVSPVAAMPDGSAAMLAASMAATRAVQRNPD